MPAKFEAKCYVITSVLSHVTLLNFMSSLELYTYICVMKGFFFEYSTIVICNGDYLIKRVIDH